LNKILTEIYKVSCKVQNKETLRIKTLIRGQQQMDDTWYNDIKKYKVKYNKTEYKIIQKVKS